MPGRLFRYSRYEFSQADKHPVFLSPGYGLVFFDVHNDRQENGMLYFLSPGLKPDCHRRLQYSRF